MGGCTKPANWDELCRKDHGSVCDFFLLRNHWCVCYYVYVVSVQSLTRKGCNCRFQDLFFPTRISSGARGKWWWNESGQLEYTVVKVDGAAIHSQKVAICKGPWLTKTFMGVAIAIYPPRRLTWQWKINHLEMYFLLKMLIFQYHVSFQGCTFQVVYRWCIKLRFSACPPCRTKLPGCQTDSNVGIQPARVTQQKVPHKIAGYKENGNPPF